jgi:dTMP kinase
MSERRGQGRFIVFEGLDGCGKTTQARRAAAALRRQGRAVILCREPGGTPVGERIRRILLDPRLPDMAVATELFLYMASRAQLVREVVRPALAAGTVVLADRFVLSSLVYQTVTGVVSEEAVRAAAAVALGDLGPDLQLIFDVPVHVALARKRRPPDRMEGKGRGFLERVRQAYLAAAAREPRTVLLPGEPAVERVHGWVMKELARVL